MKKVAYYAGCLASLSAKELDSSTRALAPQLDLELVDMPKATCCGAGDIHEAKPDFYLHLNARVLSQAEQMGVDTLMTICNVCTLNLRQANQRMQADEAVRERVNKHLLEAGIEPYLGTVDVQHFLWLITTGDRYEKLKAVAGGRLKGMKVAPFYGCQILRPSKILGFEDPDSPQSLEKIIEACGGTPIDYPAKLKCCGFPIVLARESVALNEVTQPLDQAKERGADCIVTPCPLCHLSLDAWQGKAEKQSGKKFDMPTLHMSQLIGLAAGLESSELKFQRHVTPVGKKIRDAVVR
jgi:succinate dehydrogenase / fumarate reductase cytochrome b subunit